jgi:50S ribosomal protein L4
MAKVEVINVEGKKVKELTLNDNVFGIEPNMNVVHSVVLNYLANQRQGTQNTKTRAEVAGGGRKPWRQKGTGRARQGSIRAPQWIKGGIALGPKPRSYKYKINKKERALAVRSVLSAKLAENELVVVDQFGLNEIKTAKFAKILNNIKAEGKSLVVIPENDINVQKSARNIKGVKTTIVDTMTVYDILNARNLVITENAIKKIEEVYA